MKSTLHCIVFQKGIIWIDGVRKKPSSVVKLAEHMKGFESDPELPTSGWMVEFFENGTFGQPFQWLVDEK